MLFNPVLPGFISNYANKRMVCVVAVRQVINEVGMVGLNVAHMTGIRLATSLNSN